MKFKLDENIGNRSAELLRAQSDAILARVRDFIGALSQRPLGSELWIVEPGRVRVHQTDD